MLTPGIELSVVEDEAPEAGVFVLDTSVVLLAVEDKV